MITLIGVGHVFALSPTLRSLVLGLRPTAVAVELDWDRLQLLQERERQPLERDPLPSGPLLFWVLGRFQEWVAGAYGTEVGAEMLSAATAAKDIGAKLHCIDRDVVEVVREIEDQLTWRERGRLVWSLAVALVRRDGSLEDEMARYQSDDVGYLDQFGQEFPTLKRILIDERNDHMAGELHRLASVHGHTIAVVGDGHVPGLEALLQARGHAVEAVRLSQLRDGSALDRLGPRPGPDVLPWPPVEDTPLPGGPPATSDGPDVGGIAVVDFQLAGTDDVPPPTPQQEQRR